MKKKDSCINFGIVSSDPSLVYEVLELDNNFDLALVDCGGPELSKKFIETLRAKTVHIPIILLKAGARYIPPGSKDLPEGVFMVFPREDLMGIDSEAKLEQLRNCILFTGNTLRKVHRSKSPCCDNTEHQVLYSGRGDEQQDTGRSFGAPQESRPVLRLPHNRARLLAIGISTGGPETLQTLLKDLPVNFPAPIFIIQHIQQNFIGDFVTTLKKKCALPIVIAEDGMECKDGVIYISPGTRHLGVKGFKRNAYSKPQLRVSLSKNNTPQNGHCPSVGYLYDSIANSGISDNTVALIMTGMGADGSKEIGKIKERGGLCIAQDELSSTVFGMPKVAIESGNIHRVLPLHEIAETLNKIFTRGFIEPIAGK